jgi:hypothetical protein
MAKNAQEWQHLNNGTVPPGLSAQEQEKFQKKLADFKDPAEYADESPWRWSLYAKKTVVPGFRIFLQAARDHFRVMDYGAAPSYEPIFHRKGLFEDWYWALKLEFGA